MRKLLYLLLIMAAVSGLVSSCTKDKASKPIDVNCTGIDAGQNSYGLRIKSIIDANCATFACHDALFISGNINMTTYNGTRDAFESKNALCSIKQEQGCLAMPQGQSKLADSLITYIACWAQNGYAQ